MMCEEVFSKARTEDVLKTLRAGRSLSPGKDGWTLEDLTFIGGVCLYFTWALSGKIAGISTPEAKALFGESMAFATGWYARMTALVDNGFYDEEHEPECRAGVGVINGRPMVVPISGFRSRKGVDRPSRGGGSPPKGRRR